MSKHGWYNSRGTWIEEECNAYCRGDHHATVVHTEVDGDPLRDLPPSLLRNNPSMVVVDVRPADEVRRYDDETLEDHGYHLRAETIAPFLVIFAAEPRP